MAPPITTVVRDRDCSRAASELITGLPSGQEIATAERALHESRLVGTALGILVERYRITVENAFDVLADISKETGEEVCLVARKLVETGRCPASPEADT